MEDARTDQAKARIDHALARIERALLEAPAVADSGWTAHRALKARVRDTLTDLDKLIAELER